MIRPNQVYMATGWTAEQLTDALTEPSLANPPWERNAYEGTYSTHNQRCVPCGVGWRSTDEATVCWMCGLAPEHEPRNELSTLRAPIVEREWEYAGQPKTPDSGCGCADPTVDAVAGLIADGWDLWKACLETYGVAA